MQKHLSPDVQLETFISEKLNGRDVAVQSGQLFAMFDDETDAEIAKGALQKCGCNVTITPAFKSGFTLTGSVR